ncbi:5-methyltetrahydropteroyltriglutamate--homocysteine methyltransferase [Xylanimonas oleitrophica]|uniref:5-methyltetrahydropteroyltriglutamate--homocysteine methyltransferase n=1 Tax=Xylanimonas oleitrophica TaxID=2607479 RepID=A0A2W5WQ43_9MICO|nr:cobalamin-independent methionine synthase II family protein [Xylanimonas oleitrophica]PZR53699.1 5-methyltetrahydropteroyltriglutamate--homocysteine methyltransferase [Xylanimonas oleitrophica]
MSTRFHLVGSLLRPEDLLKHKAVIEQRDDITYPFYDDLPGYLEAEVAAARAVVEQQIAHGVEVLTDGEQTRSMWHLDFVWGLGGTERFIADHGYYFRDLDEAGTYETRRDIGVRVVAPLSGKDHHFIELFRRLTELAGSRPTKLSIPSPSHVFGELSGKLFGAPNAGRAEGVYATADDLKAGLLEAYRNFVTEYAAAGGTILQLDDCLWEMFADDNPSSPFTGGAVPFEQVRGFAHEFIELNNSLIDHAHGLGLKVWTHNCRGNYASRNMGGGSYAKIAELFLRQQRYDRFFLEWDDERAGSLEALQALADRPEAEVVLGLLSSKSADLDDEERARRLLDEASAIIPKERLHLSHQCGFASTNEGNELSEEQQWAKVDQGQRIAQEFWGS